VGVIVTDDLIAARVHRYRSRSAERDSGVRRSGFTVTLNFVLAVIFPVSLTPLM